MCRIHFVSRLKCARSFLLCMRGSPWVSLSYNRDTDVQLKAGPALRIHMNTLYYTGRFYSGCARVEQTSLVLSVPQSCSTLLKKNGLYYLAYCTFCRRSWIHRDDPRRFSDDSVQVGHRRCVSQLQVIDKVNQTQLEHVFYEITNRCSYMQSILFHF